MTTMAVRVMAAGLAALVSSVAFAEVTLNSVRVAATDTEALAKFIFVNFGTTVDAAKANRTPPVVIMHRDSDAMKDPIAHVIFNVTDMNATVAAIKAAGGTMTGEPRPYQNTGIVIGIAVDPAGNRIELIQRPTK
jgi:predicted enzyme related to lactoylglutathione lyase